MSRQAGRSGRDRTHCVGLGALSVGVHWFVMLVWLRLDLCKDIESKKKSLPGCPLTTALTSVARPILKVSGDVRDVCTARRLFTLCLALASMPTGSSCLSAGAVSHLHDMSTEGNAALCMATIDFGQSL
jgi:hypothetical protein